MGLKSDQFSWAGIPEEGKNNVWFTGNNDSDSVLVFVHGVHSDSRSCWLHEIKKQGSRNRYWPSLVHGDQQRIGNLPIFLAGYSTKWNSGPLVGARSSARSLLRSLELPDPDGNKPAMARRNIIFVCHSLGGVVVRYMLESNWPDFKDKNVGLLLIASPSYGSHLANHLRFLIRLADHRLGRELQWGNMLVSDLDERFRQLLDEKRIPTLVGHEAYESHPIIRRWLPRSLVVVNKESAGRYFQSDVLEDTDHKTCVKPDALEHPSHVMLLDFLSKYQRRTGVSLGGLLGSTRPAQPPLVSESQARPKMAPQLAELACFVWNDEFERCQTLLTQEGRVVISGLAGSGKTVLATRLARSPQIAASLPDGVLWVSLGEQPNLRAIASACCVELGLSQQEVASLGLEERLSVIRSRLRDKRALFVIEDITDAALLGDLMLGGGQCRYIVTTRNAELGAALAHEDLISLSAMRQTDRVNMFTALVSTESKLQRDKAALMEKLPGTPLEIALFVGALNAGGQTSTKNLLARDELQQDLPRLVQASYAALPSRLQSLARKLALFPPDPNTFSETAVLSICGVSSADLEQLCRFSLLSPRPPGRYSWNLVPLQFAAGSDERAQAGLNMLEFYAQYTETHAADFGSLSIERRNIEAALNIELTPDTRPLFGRAANPFGAFLIEQGEYEEALSVATRAVVAAKEAKAQDTLAFALLNVGRVLEKLGKYDESITKLNEALAAAADSATQSSIHQVLAVTYQSIGRNRESERATAAALALEPRDRGVRAELLARTAVLRSRQGRFDEAEQQNIEARQLAREIRNRVSEAFILTNLAILEVRRGNYKPARAYAVEGLQLAREIGQREREAGLLHALGAVERLTGNVAEAERRLKNALDIAAAIGHTWYQALMHKELGELYLDAIRYAAAQAQFETSLALISGSELHAGSLFGLARALDQQGHPERAMQAAERSRAEFAVLEDYELARVEAWVAERVRA